MTTILIEFLCENCSLRVKAYIHKKRDVSFSIKENQISFSIHGNLYNENDVLSEIHKNYVCIECKHKNNIRFIKFL